MKIRALDAIGEIKVGDVIDALAGDLSIGEMIVYEPKQKTTWFFYNDRMPKYEIVEEENQEIIDLEKKLDHDFASISGIQNIPKVYGNKYTLSELKELKELFK